MGEHREPADDFRNEPVGAQVLRCKVPEQPIVVESGRIGRVVTYGMGVQSARNAFVDTVEGTSANEEDVRRIDLYEFLVGVFASSLRRNVHDRAFEYLQQCLLYPFAGYVARDGWVVAFTGYLVYLVDEDDAPFGLPIYAC